MSNFDELVKNIKAEGYVDGFNDAQAQVKEKYTKALEDTKEDIFKSLLNEGWSTEKAHKLVYGLK